MIARDRPRRSAKPAPKEEPSFRLERFGWGAPDRLELAGTFAGLSATSDDRPELVLVGTDGTHRLPAAPDEETGTPENGRPWHAAFVWQEEPAAFQAAILELGGALAVQLPEPGEDGEADGEVALAVRPVVQPADGGPGAGLLRLEAELLTAREELRETTAAAARAREELRRAQADLEEERAERSADAERFRAGLEQMRAAAEAALTAERAAAEAAEAQHRGELDAAAALWADADEQAKAERAELAERVDALTAEVAELEHMRGELAAARAEADSARRRIAAARDALDASGA